MRSSLFLFEGETRDNLAATEMAAELEVVDLVFILCFGDEGAHCTSHAQQAIALIPELAGETHCLSLIKNATLHTYGTAGAAAIPARKWQGITLSLEAVEDVLALGHLMGDGSILLPPVNADSMAGAHPARLETPCYIRICPT